jgi:predicted dehydrogenase
VSYRVGIVGSGFGGTVHAPAFALHPQFELVAIASPNRAKQIAADRNIPNAFASLDEMLAAIGDRIDVVSVATPPHERHRTVMTAIAAGKHVLAEKPLARTVAQAEEMVAAAQRAAIAAAVAFEFRYGSAQQALREMVVNGHLPLVREIETIRFGTDLRRELKRPRSSWWFDRAKGGGVPQAFMPHYIDLATWIPGRTTRSATGLLRTANPQRSAPDGTTYPSTVPDGGFVLADLGDGLVGRVTVDSTLSLDQCTIAVHGETRSAVASGPNLIDMALYVVEGDESSELELRPNPHAKHAAVHASVPLFMSLLDDFATLIATGGGPAPTFADGLAAQRVLAAIGYED